MCSRTRRSIQRPFAHWSLAMGRAHRAWGRALPRGRARGPTSPPASSRRTSRLGAPARQEMRKRHARCATHARSASFGVRRAAARPSVDPNASGLGSSRVEALQSPVQPACGFPEAWSHADSFHRGAEPPRLQEPDKRCSCPSWSCGFVCADPPGT